MVVTAFIKYLYSLIYLGMVVTAWVYPRNEKAKYHYSNFRYKVK